MREITLTEVSILELLCGVPVYIVDENLWLNTQKIKK